MAAAALIPLQSTNLQQADDRRTITESETVRRAVRDKWINTQSESTRCATGDRWTNTQSEPARCAIGDRRISTQSETARCVIRITGSTHSLNLHDVLSGIND